MLSEYEALIYPAVNRGWSKKTAPVYVEAHHIKPRCLGGDDTADNLVVLTAQEHYEAHRLLAAIYPDNHKLAHAWWLMANSTGRRIIEISAEEYAKARKAHAHATGVFHKELWNDPEYRAARPSMSGELNPNYGNGQALSGSKNFFYGKTHEKGTIEIISQTHKGKATYRNIDGGELRKFLVGEQPDGWESQINGLVPVKSKNNPEDTKFVPRGEIPYGYEHVNSGKTVYRSSTGETGSFIAGEQPTGWIHINCGVLPWDQLRVRENPQQMEAWKNFNEIYEIWGSSNNPRYTVLQRLVRESLGLTASLLNMVKIFNSADKFHLIKLAHTEWVKNVPS
ncbi:HNH endonuclease signature motif containing protein [Colwellia piezophila]|uniref:HNH endonuclease signature motif containing protein n=1 Tax=Colwellia piezophila TaxID=211668 RepID=UPI000361C7B1|nr:HNH endonuclease signature motif containing protein [Colwellia piezophila]